MYLSSSRPLPKAGCGLERKRHRATTSRRLAWLCLVSVTIGGCADGGGTAPPDRERSGQRELDAGPPEESERTRGFSGSLEPLNDSRARGEARLWLRGRRLTASVRATGLTARRPHILRVYRPEDGDRATCPSASADRDGNEVVNLREARDFLGVNAVALKPFPVADAAGRVEYSKTRSVRDPQLLEGAALVLHGLKPNAEFRADLPAACAELRPR